MTGTHRFTYSGASCGGVPPGASSVRHSGSPSIVLGWAEAWAEEVCFGPAEEEGKKIWR